MRRCDSKLSLFFFGRLSNVGLSSTRPLRLAISSSCYFASLAFVACFVATAWPDAAHGDGGTLRLSEQAGAYQITVFTSPTPLRCGPVDISVLVQDPATGAVVSEVEVAIQMILREQPSEALRYQATTEAATNKLFRAAQFDLPQPGWWVVEVTVEGTRGPGRIQFELEAAPPIPRWIALWPWFTWPLLAIALFSMHQVLTRRRSGGRVFHVVTR